MESSEVLNGKAPVVGTRCRLGLKPTMPQSAAGIRTEPPVSLPIAISAMPSPTVTAAPDDEPPGMRARSRGLPGVPKCGLAPIAPSANSVMLVLATITAAGGAKPPHDRRVGCGRLRFVGEDFRAGSRRLAGDVEQILDADDRSVERAERHAVLRAGIGGVRRRARRLGIDGQARCRALPFRIGDANKRLFEAVTG